MIRRDPAQSSDNIRASFDSMRELAPAVKYPYELVRTPYP